jgi:hypothetical protein
MDRNLWEHERRTIFKNLLKEYQEEGYDKHEAGSLARKETNEIMVEKEGFVSDIWNSAYEED